MIHTVIVPGVGGSDSNHWQSWLQNQLLSCSRVHQKDWGFPLLTDWIHQFVNRLNQIDEPVQIVAHSFGCLTTVAAIQQHPELAKKIKKLILVAPANPSRFGENGFARNSLTNYSTYFHQIKINIPTTMLISENDPWLSFKDAKNLARAWNIKPINLGQVGHINVEAGFGPFPEIFDFLIPEKLSRYISNIDDTKLNYKFAF
jgi:uncharacterized protein